MLQDKTVRERENIRLETHRQKAKSALALLDAEWDRLAKQAKQPVYRLRLKPQPAKPAPVKPVK